jgi:dTDP-4-amino-4,6-dideoxygalactose transaminase
MKIIIERNSREKYYALLKKVFDSGFLSEGAMVRHFEEQFGKFVHLKATAVSSAGAGLLALLAYADVKGKDVIVPTNTFMATPLAVAWAGGRVVFADINKEDLSLSVKSLEGAITKNTKAVIVVHIGGHIAFDIFEIARLCKERNLVLIEDCAHAHGAEYKNRCAGSFGLGGAYSFYGTKTMPLGEGGTVVSRYEKVIRFVEKFRNYGKFDYRVKGFNFRMNEITAAFGLIQLERLPAILRWKRGLAKKFDLIFENRVYLPPHMLSGYYKYIVFDTELREETGRVFDRLCHEIMAKDGNFPNASWVKCHHRCAPIYYGWDNASKSIEELRSLLIKIRK